MSSYAEHVLVQFRSKGALVDSNLLLLLLIGSFDLGLLGEHGFKRVAKYTVQDYSILVLLLKQFKTCVTTPHILTEVSNLAGQLPESQKSGCFGRFVETLGRFAELNNTDSFAAALRPEFVYLGLTDCVLTTAASEYLVITDDLRFCSSLQRAGLDALNFNHIRTLAW